MLKRIIISILFVSVTTIAFASSGGEAGSLFSLTMGFKVINFLILLYLLNKFARPAIANMLSNAAKGAKERVDEAEAKLKEAEHKLADYQNKMANLEKDMAKMQEDALVAIENEKEKMVADAKETAGKIEQQSQARIEQDILKAKMEVRAYLVDESIKLAEKFIAEKVDSKEQKALISDYVKVIQEIA
jgi:F-type H+-transporting ATPase subunit b